MLMLVLFRFFPALLCTYFFLKHLNTLGIPLYFKNRISKSGVMMDTCHRRVGHGLDRGHCKTVSKYSKEEYESRQFWLAVAVCR